VSTTLPQLRGASIVSANKPPPPFFNGLAIYNSLERHGSHYDNAVDGQRFLRGWKWLNYDLSCACTIIVHSSNSEKSIFVYITKNTLGPPSEQSGSSTFSASFLPLDLFQYPSSLFREFTFGPLQYGSRKIPRLALTWSTKVVACSISIRRFQTT
jgi:hypothetical protein